MLVGEECAEVMTTIKSGTVEYQSLGEPKMEKLKFQFDLNYIMCDRTW
jgi:hypothetical protein